MLSVARLARLASLEAHHWIGYHPGMLRFILALLCCLALALPAWAGYDEGAAAYESGDYETALREWRHTDNSV